MQISKCTVNNVCIHRWNVNEVGMVRKICEANAYFTTCFYLLYSTLTWKVTADLICLLIVVIAVTRLFDIEF